MNLKGKKIIALLLAFVLVFTNNNVVSVALEVWDGETKLEEPDGNKWQQYVLEGNPNRTINLFDGSKATNRLSVALAPEDLNNAGEEVPDEYGGSSWKQTEDKSFVFINTDVSGNMSGGIGVGIYKDANSKFTDTSGMNFNVSGGNYSGEIPSDSISNGLLDDLMSDESIVGGMQVAGAGHIKAYYDPIDGGNVEFKYTRQDENSYRGIGDWGTEVYTSNDETTISLDFKLTVPKFYRGIEVSPVVKFRKDGDWTNSNTPSDPITISDDKTTYTFTYEYDPSEYPELAMDVAWSAFFDLNPWDGVFFVESCFPGGVLSVTPSTYDYVKHPDGTEKCEERWSFPLGEEEGALNANPVVFTVSPREGSNLTGLNLDWNENDTDFHYEFYFGVDEWKDSRNPGVTVTSTEGGVYKLTFNSEFYDAHKNIHIEIFTDDGPGSGMGDGDFFIRFDNDENAKVGYKIGSGQDYIDAENNRRECFIEGDEIQKVSLKLTPPESYRGKDIIPMVVINQGENRYSSFDETPTIGISEDQGFYYCEFTSDDETPFEINVYWSEYYFAPYDYQNGEFRYTSIVNGSGNVGVSQSVEGENLHIYSHPEAANRANCEKYVMPVPTESYPVYVYYTVSDDTVIDNIEINVGNERYIWNEGATGTANSIVSKTGNTYTVAVTEDLLSKSDDSGEIVVFVNFPTLPSSEGSIEINYDPMSNAKVEYSIGESDYSSLNGHGFINYLDENRKIKGSVKLLVTPPDFYLGKNIEPIMVYPEELSDCVVMTRDGDKYLYTFTPPTDETPSFRVDFIWSDFYAWDIDWSSQFKIESQIVDGNGNIIVSPNPGESNTYRHPEAAQMNGQEIRVFNLNTDITYTLTPNANCYVSEIEIRREAEGSNNIDVAYTFDESQVGGKWVLWDETNPGMVTESTSAEGCYVITIPGSNAWGNYYISVRFKQGQSGIKGGSDDFKGAKKILEGTNFGYAGSKDDIEADLEWELWYSYFGYLKSRDSEGTFYGMFGTVNKEDNSKADNGDYRDERKPYAIDYTGPSEAFKNAVTLSEGTSTTGSVVDGLPYYTYMVDFKNCSAWTSGAPESAEGKVYVLSNYTDIVVGFKNDTGVTNYQVVDASLSSFDGRTTVYGDYGESGTVIIFGNGAGSVGSTSREEEKQYRFSIHVTQELSNMHMRRSYQIETAPPQPGSDFNAQVNEGKPGINCNLGIVNTIIEGFEVTPHYEKGTAAAWGWTDWPLYWTNGSSESNPIVFEMYKGCTWLEINSLDNESRPSITNIECTLPYAGKAVKIEKNGTTYKFTLLSDYYDEIPLKITYSNSKVGYATLRFVAIDIQRGRTIWHGTDNSKDAGNDSVITASYYYLSDQTMTVNLFATLTLGDGSVVTKTVTPYGARVTDANQGTNQVDDFIVWKQGDTPSMPIKVEVIAIVPDSGDSFGGALIGSGSGVCKVVE